MSILVTGGAGYIGSHTVIRLLENDYDVIVIDNLSNSHKAVVKRIKSITNKEITFHQEDIRNYNSMTKIFNEHQIDAVMHFAALKAVGESVEKSLEYYDNNVSGTVSLLKAMKNANVHKFVYSSSACVYGNNISPFTEDMPTNAINPYGQTKIMVEQILADLCYSDNNFKAIALRYFNPVGAHESGLIGEDPNGIPNNLPPYITQTLIGKREKLTVFGDDYDTHDGTCIRDYIHVLDLAEGHVAALKFLAENHGFHAINLGRGKGESVLDLIKTFEEASSKKIPYVIGKRRPGDGAISYAEVSKAKKLLNWEAKRNLDAMCKDALNWQEKNPNGYN